MPDWASWPSARPKIRFVVAALVVCAYLSGTALARASETATLHASFSPDALGVSTNLSASVRFTSTTPGPQPPLTKVTAYGPSGMSVDVRGARTCTVTPAKLEAVGPTACPRDSRVGFGTATGLQELAGELIQAPFSLEFFLAPMQDGHLVLFIYVNAITPAVEQLVMVAREVRAPKPYGVGVSFQVPIVPSLPGAPLGWVEHVLLTFGSTNTAYYKTIHGRRQLVHVRGLVTPRTCPHGGFPIEGDLEFADASTTVTRTTIPCPHR
jgi:hypothetical protein